MNKDTGELTQNELIELLINQLNLEEQTDDGFLTMREIARAVGWTVVKTQSKLRELFEEGRIECRYVDRVNIAKKRAAVPAYRLIEGES